MSKLPVIINKTMKYKLVLWNYSSILLCLVAFMFLYYIAQEIFDLFEFKFRMELQKQD